ncbi:MAG: hypothetical protein OXU74_17375 [Gemmatimonadota bacterium]|nr:hypothetical protein [Gemmatimonadota bacterium]
MESSPALALLTITAILLGPIVALWIQRISERKRNRHNRKLYIFQDLMASRATRTSPRHVDALNAIEVEFSGGGKQDARVLGAWRLYLNHLETQVSDDLLPQWTEKSNDLLIDLLYEMSQALKYGFDKVTLKKNIYAPKAHGDLEVDQYLLRKYVVEMMAGQRPIWIGVLTGDKPLDVRVVERDSGNSS